jgi:hypothetical protein
MSSELWTAGRKFLAGLLLVFLLVAFLADRPKAAASVPPPRVGSAAPVAEGSPEVRPAAIIGGLRQPWFALYRLAGAPRLDGNKLNAAEERQFTVSVGRLGCIFFVAAVGLSLAGGRVVAAARRA